MFFVTYLRRELRRRMRQAIFIALGLALGVGLVVTVAAASAGVKKAQSGVLSALYGVGTDATVTGAVPGPPKAGSASNKNQNNQNNNQNAVYFMLGSNGQPEICNSNGKCSKAAGKTVDTLSTTYSGISASMVAEVARLRGVAAAAGGVSLTASTITFTSSGSSGSPVNYTLDGTDTGKPSLGPLSSASLTSGHSFTAADANADVAVVDSGYAKSNNLKTGSVLTIDKIKFTVIGIVRQPQASSPPDVYIPLQRVRALSVQSGGGSLDSNDVTTIYVAAASATGVPAVSKEISKLLPGATVTTQSSLAGEVTGSVSSAAKLANDLGKWLAVLVLIAAFAVACLLTMAAVARRAAEFGTLKAIGWRSRRIVTQVLGESVAMGIVGAAVGVGLGFAGAAIISAVAPKLSAIVGGNTGPQASLPAGAHGNVGTLGGAAQPHTVSVPLHPSITVGVIVLAVALAVAGALLAGSFGSWRIAKLRPADALSRVA
jgi:putative ABC transport system permease protein